jgi:predicted nucleotide-binding protein (sugar kinase/HSP70/actin superfamily)
MEKSYNISFLGTILISSYNKQLQYIIVGRRNKQSIQGRIAIGNVIWIRETMWTAMQATFVMNGRPRNSMFVASRQGGSNA